MKGVVFLVFILELTFATSAIGFRIRPVAPALNASKDLLMELYTLKNPNEPQFLVINDTNSIIESNYNPNVPTRILIHGFRSKGKIGRIITEAYFDKGKHNVNLIILNWEKVSGGVNYYLVRNKVEQIGNFTAEFIDFLVDNNKLQLSDLTLIGFSLGAHCAGIAGKRLRSGKLPKIVGLDPASPLFSLNKPHERLDSHDAIYVETVHTSRLGFFNPIGSVSFYANGGRVQPECKSWDVVCQHQTAYMYFAHSVHSKEPFYGRLCNSLNDLKGGNCSANDQKAYLGGEPGAKEQPAGIYYISIKS